MSTPHTQHFVSSLPPEGASASLGAARRESVSTRKKLRALAEARRGLLVPGAFNALSARVIEDLGFEAIYVTGAGVTNMSLGLPDQGFMGLAEIAEHTARIRDAVELPLIVDADTGFGNALNVRHTVRVLERAGADCIQFEDQVAPKRCGHLSGHQIVPLGEFAGKIRAAVEARRDPDLLIIARTDAISAVGFDEALRRGEAAARAGADVLFIEAPRDEAQVEKVARAFDTPLLYNYASGGRSPLLPMATLRALRFAIVILPVDTLMVATKAMADFLGEVRRRDDVLALADRYFSFAEFNTLIGVTDQMALADRYKDA